MTPQIELGELFAIAFALAFALILVAFSLPDQEDVPATVPSAEYGRAPR